MTNPPSSEYEPVDPSVRTFLWRLRARLVNPPHEERVAADLDRLFEAARDHAHDEPLFADVVRIDSAPAPAASAVDPSSDTEALPDGVSPIFGAEHTEASPLSTRHLGSLFGRVAAAAVLLVAVGGGIVGTRDGNVSLTALLGRSGVPEVDASDENLLALQPDPELVPEAEASEEPEPAPVDEAPEADVSEPSGDVTPDEPASEPAEPTEPSTNESSTGATDGTGASDSDTGSEQPAVPEPDADGEASVTEPVEGEIIAAPEPDPEPRPVDGFGGPTCPEDGDPALCELNEDAASDEADADGDADATGGAADGEADPDAEDTVESERDELARRRGGA